MWKIIKILLLFMVFVASIVTLIMAVFKEEYRYLKDISILALTASTLFLCCDEEIADIRLW